MAQLGMHLIGNANWKQLLIFFVMLFLNLLVARRIRIPARAGGLIRSQRLIRVSLIQMLKGDSADAFASTVQLELTTRLALKFSRLTG